MLGVAALALAAANPAGAAQLKSPFMPVGEAVEPPYGYFDYCHRLESDCSEFDRPGVRPDESSVNSSYWDLVFQARPAVEKAQVEPAVVADLSAAKWREVAEINRRINRSVRASSDQQEFGRNDYWSPPRRRQGRAAAGDCEDYVLQKRIELIEAGVPEGALSIAIAKRWGDVHAVLLLATPTGEFVLDNRSSWISRWYDLNYRWERRQAPGGKEWVRVTSSRSRI